jgi:VWFA-related protein
MDARPVEPAGESKNVTIVATVTDRDHQLVSGLRSGDFEVQDDGHVCQSIAFDASRWPLSVTVVLDRGESLLIGPEGVRAAAARFIADLQPNDEARVCISRPYTACAPRFSTDHEELALELRHVRSHFGSRLYDTLSSALDAMPTIPLSRRRVIVVLSDGEDNGSQTAFRHVMDRARESDVMVFGIGLLTRIDDGDDIVSSRPDRTLMPLATETGGDYFEPDNHTRLEGIVTRIEEELRHQYVLTFSPVSNAGGSHRLLVRATRPNLRVRTRGRFSTPQR